MGKSNEMGFAETMYAYKYIEELDVKSFKVGYKYNAAGDVHVIDLTPEEFIKYCHGYFEYLSNDNKWYRAEVLGKKVRKDKKHLRLAFKATELKNLAIARNNNYEPELYTAEECKKALAKVKPYWNQDNKGYMTEVLILGDNWNPRKRGIDIDEGHIEIKYMNGQIEL